MSFSGTQTLIQFKNEWIPELFSWINNQRELVLWSGNTFAAENFTHQSIHQHLQQNDISPYAILDDNKSLLAYGEIVRRKKEGRLNLCRVIIHPLYRGKGIGKIFCRLLLEKCMTYSGYNCVRLNVIRNNWPAVSCYSSLGFKKIGVFPKARKLGGIELDLLIMSKPLTNV